MTFSINFKKDIPFFEHIKTKNNNSVTHVFENQKYYDKLQNQKNAKISWAWKASEYFLLLYTNNTYETKEMEITFPFIKTNLHIKTYRAIESLVLEKPLDDDKEISDCKRIAKKVLKIFLKIILVIFLPVATLISNSYRKKYNVPKYFPTINNETMEEIYRSSSLSEIKSEKNIGLTSKQIENSENVRNWFLKNGKHLKTIETLDLSKKSMMGSCTLKNVYLNDLLSLFPSLKTLNVSRTQANVKKLPTSLKIINN